MNDLEMFREELAHCDEKIIDALNERYAIVEKIVKYKEEYGIPSSSRFKVKNGIRIWRLYFRTAVIKMKYWMCLAE